MLVAKLSAVCDLLQDYLYLHKEHKDWITKLKWVPELGLVTGGLVCCSMGARLTDYCRLK